MPGNAVIGALRATAGLDSAAFTEGLSKMQKELKAAGARLQSIGKGIATVGAGWTAAITAPLIGIGAIAVGEASEMKDALGQVNAALTSMGAVGGRSLEQLKTQADSLAGSSLFEDDQILRDVTANLLTFGNVAGTQFDRAQQAAVDLSARLKGGLQGATLLVGKALNDPVKGMAALSRAGIQLSASQKATIKSMVAAGNAAGAQNILLTELEKQFGGSAAAARENAPPLERMSLAFKSMAGDIGTLLLPVVTKLATFFEGLTAKFGTLSPAMQQTVVIVGAVAAAIGPLLIGLGGLVTAAGAIAGAFAGGGALAGLLPFLGPIGLAVGALVIAFMAFKDDIIPVVKDFAAAVKENVGPKIAPLFEALKGAVAAIGAVFVAIFSSNGGSASANIMAFGQVIARVFGAAVDILTGAINVITNVLKALGALLKGDFSGMWAYLGQAVLAAVTGIGRAFETLFPNVINSVRQMVAGVRDWLVTRFQTMVVEPVRQRIDAVKGFFFGLYDAVVGHSYIPDMVEGVAAWMAKLDAGMVVPARNATAAAKTAFQTLRDDVASIMEGLLTDTERATRELANNTATIRKAVAAGMISGQTGQRLEAGVAGKDLQKADVPALNPLGTDAVDIGASIKEGLAKSKAAFDETARNFGDAFAYNMEGVLRGDIKGVFQSLLSDVLRSSLSSLGSSLFKSASAGSFGSIGSTLASMFGGAKLPGFKDGGSFTVGGSGTADSKLAAFRVTPGERVDITKGNQRPAGGATDVRVSVDKSRYFDVEVQRIAAPVAAEFAGHSFAGARQAVPQDMAKTNRYSRGRR